MDIHFCCICKSDFSSPVKWFTYDLVRNIRYPMCTICYKKILKCCIEDKSKTKREYILMYSGLPECDGTILEKKRNKKLYEEYGVLGHDRPTLSTIGICNFCHKEGPLWLRSSFLDYEDNKHRDIVLCYSCTAEYNLRQSALLKSFINKKL